MHISPARVVSVLRIAIGAIILQIGIGHILNSFSANALFSNAGSYPDFFAWFVQSSNLPWVNFLCSWGLVIVGGMLILGPATRFASLIAIIGIIMLYLIQLHFPEVGGFLIVSHHIVYIVALATIASFHEENAWSLDNKLPVKL